MCKKDKDLEIYVHWWNVRRQKDVKLLRSFLAVLDSCSVWQIFHRCIVLQWNLTNISTSWLSPQVLLKFKISFLKALYYLNLILVGRYFNTFMCLACLLSLRFWRSMNYWNNFFWDSFSLIFFCAKWISSPKYKQVYCSLGPWKMCWAVIKAIPFLAFPHPTGCYTIIIIIKLHSSVLRVLEPLLSSE